MSKVFNLKSIFMDMYFEDRKTPSKGYLPNFSAPSGGWNLEPSAQPDRTLSPVMRRQQTDDIMVTTDNMVENKLDKSEKPKSKKDKKTLKELGLMPTKKRLKFITENPSDSGHSQMGPGSGVTETNNENKVKPIPVRKPQNTVRENNVEWLDKLSSILPDGNKTAYKLQDILSEKIKKYDLNLDSLLRLTEADIKKYFIGNRMDFGGYIREWVDDVMAAASIKLYSVVKPEQFSRFFTSEQEKELLDWAENMLRQYDTQTKKSFSLNSSEVPKRDIMEEGYQLMPRRDFPDGFHKRPVLTPYDQGHLPFMRGKEPGENLSKTPIEDLPTKPFFENKIFRPKKKHLQYDVKKSIHIADTKLDWGSSLHKKYISELLHDYKEKLMSMAVDVWQKKGISREDIITKWDELSDKLDKISKNEFIEIYNSYATELYGSYEDFKKRVSNVDIIDSSHTDIGKYDNMLKSPEYHKKEKGVKFEIVNMSPDEYLSKVAQMQGVSLSDTLRMISEENMQELREVVKAGKKLPLPFLDYADNFQEGRHRAVLAKELGQTSIPVMIITKVEAIEKDESRADGLNPKPYYGDSNIYPYRGTGPMLPSSTFIEPFDTVTREVRVSTKVFKLTANINIIKDESFKHSLYNKLSALDDGKEVGYLVYGVDADTIFIRAIGVQELYQGKRIATQMIDFVTNEFPNRILDWGATSSDGTKLKEYIETRKSFKLVAQEEEDKPTVSQYAYDAFTEKSYVFKNYQLIPEQIEDAIDKGKDLSILLKYQKMVPDQKQRAINRAIEKNVALIYLYENEKESLTDAQYKHLINSLYKKAMEDGTNLIYILRNFELPPAQKETLVQKALEEGIGLHFLFKKRLLTPEQQDYAVKKAIETGYGLLDLLKYMDLTPEQRKIVIDKCIEKGVALVHLLRKETLTEEQKNKVFSKSLREGKGYHYILRNYKLTNDQINLAIRRSKHKPDNLKLIQKYQDVTPEQTTYIDSRIEKMKSKKSSVDPEYSFVLPGEEGFEELQQFFREADDESVMKMYEYIESDNLENAKRLLEGFIGAEL